MAPFNFDARALARFHRYLFDARLLSYRDVEINQSAGIAGPFCTSPSLFPLRLSLAARKV